MSGLGDRIRTAGEQLSAAGPSAIPGWMTTIGIVSWLIIGMAGVIALTGWFFAVSASITVPLTIAAVIGMIAYPLCERMIAHRVPKSVAALIVILMLMVIVVVVAWIVFVSVVSQMPNIQAQLQAGVASLTADLKAQGIDAESVNAALTTGQETAKSAASGGGLVKSVASTLSSTLSSLFRRGVRSVHRLDAALLRAVRLPNHDELAQHSHGPSAGRIGRGRHRGRRLAMRGYFRATTITGFAIGPVIGATMLLMGVPLAVTVALVTFLTCYIPFFGAIISDLAFFVALSSNGLPTAIALLVIVLLTQNVLQTAIDAGVMGASLKLHPLVILVVTMLGGIFAGILGAALAAPLAALVLNAGRRLSEAYHVGVRRGRASELARSRRAALIAWRRGKCFLSRL